MRPSRVRLTVTALLFLGWVGFLVYLSATTTRPVVLSRPQFLAADAYVIAGLQRGSGKADAPAEEAVVRQVIWAHPGDEPKGTIKVRNLPACGPRFGWAGPGDYILALTKNGPDGPAYRVTPIPRSPGYHPPDSDRNTGLVPARIYPANEQTRRELSDLKAAFH